MRNLRSLLLLLAIFVVFYLSAHYWIRWRNTVKDDVTKISRLVDCEPNEMRLLELHQIVDGKVHNLRFERGDQPEVGVPAVTQFARSEWKYVAPFKGEADATVLRRIASTICELYDPIPLRAEEMQGGAPTQGATGFVAGFAGSGGFRSLHFEFGPVTESRHLVVRFVEGQKERVVRIPIQLAQASSLPPDLYKNLRVMRMEVDNVQVASLSVDGKERFSLERTGADWTVLTGGKKAGQGSEVANQFVNRLSTLRALSVEDGEYSASDCMKSKARIMVTFHGVAGKEEMLRFDYGKGGDIKACSSSRSSKFRVHRDMVKYLEVSAKAVSAK